MQAQQQTRYSLKEAREKVQLSGCNVITVIRGTIPKTLYEPRSNLVRKIKEYKAAGYTNIQYAVAGMVSKYPSAGFYIVVGARS